MNPVERRKCFLDPCHSKVLSVTNLEKSRMKLKMKLQLRALKKSLENVRDGDNFIVINEHSPENLIFDKTFLGFNRSDDFILIQITSTVGNNIDAKLAVFKYLSTELNKKLGLRPDDLMVNMVYVDRSDWSFGNGEPWT